MYDDEQKENVNTQIQKLVKKSSNLETKQLTSFDIIGIVTGAIIGIILPLPPFIGPVIGAAAGYLLTPYFVPKMMKKLKAFLDKSKDKK